MKLLYYGDTMKIVRRDINRVPNSVTVAQLAVGQTFRLEGSSEDGVYVRCKVNYPTSNEYHIRVVHLRSGVIYNYEPSKRVIPLKAEVTVFGDSITIAGTDRGD